MIAAPAATLSTTGCQPACSAMAARAGMKIKVPVAVLAVRMPMMRPRWLENQRLTTVAASTMETQPEPRPEKTPQSTMSCQDWVIRALRPTATAIRASALIMVRRIPKRCISAPAKGPTMP
jgi:hypothetical protein